MAKFNFFVPVQFRKGGEKGEEMIISGVASTTDEDMDKEVLVPNGFDLTYFKKSGYLNWHHMKTPDGIIGEPMTAEVKNNKLYLEAKLYAESKMAKDAYELMQTLEQNSNTRRLGFSIEGKAIKKEGNKVTEALITGCALTPMPKNPQTLAEIVKGVIDKTPICKSEFYPEDGNYEDGDGYVRFHEKGEKNDWYEEDSTITKINKAESESKSSSKVAQVLKEFKDGTLKDSSGKKVTNRRQALAIALSYIEDEEKAMDTSSTSAGPLIRSSLNKELKDLTNNQTKLNKLIMATKTKDHLSEDEIRKAFSNLGLDYDEMKKAQTDDEDEEEMDDQENEENEDMKKGKTMKKGKDMKKGKTMKKDQEEEDEEEENEDKDDETKEMMKALSNTIGKLNSKINSLEETINQLGETNPGKKSITKAHDKFNKEQEENKSQGISLHITRDKKRILKALDDNTFANGYDKEFSKAMTQFESTDMLPQNIVLKLKLQGINIISGE